MSVSDVIQLVPSLFPCLEEPFWILYLRHSRKHSGREMKDTFKHTMNVHLKKSTSSQEGGKENEMGGDQSEGVEEVQSKPCSSQWPHPHWWLRPLPNIYSEPPNCLRSQPGVFRSSPSSDSFSSHVDDSEPVLTRGRRWLSSLHQTGTSWTAGRTTSGTSGSTRAAA